MIFRRFTCLYRPAGCFECSGPMGRHAVDRFCSEECADAFAEAQTAMEARQEGTTAAEDAWGEEAHHSSRLATAYEQADRIMAERHLDG